MSIQEINSAQPPSSQNKIETLKPVKTVKQSAQDSSTKTKEISNQDMAELVSHVNKFVESVSTKVGFSYDTFNERQVVLVKDKETGEVIREIPPREMLNLVKQLERVTGIIYHNHI